MLSKINFDANLNRVQRSTTYLDIARRVVINVHEPPLELKEVKGNEIKYAIKGTDTSLSLELNPKNATITIFNNLSATTKIVTPYHNPVQLISEIKGFLKGASYE